MMLVSLLSYSQYPTVKTIGKDTVVIMTIKQGEDINKTFSVLNDSIKKINANFDRYMIENGQRIQKVYNDYNFELNNHKLAKLEVDSSKKEIERLNLLIKNNDKAFWREKRQWAGWMFFSFFITVFIAANK